MGNYPELFSTINRAIANASLVDAKKALERPLNEMALVDTRKLSHIKPAVRHPLGFYTLYLAPNTCIHWWPTAYLELDIPDSTTSPVHRHSMGIDSMILDGLLTNTSNMHIRPVPFSAKELIENPWQGNDRYFRLFDARSSPDGLDVMHNTNRIVEVVDTGKDATLEAGQTYSVPLGAYHMSGWHIDSLTLMTADNHPGEPNFTLGSIVPKNPEDKVDTHIVRRRILTAKETAEIAARIAIRLGLDS